MHEVWQVELMINANWIHEASEETINTVPDPKPLLPLVFDLSYLAQESEVSNDI